MVIFGPFTVSLLVRPVERSNARSLGHVLPPRNRTRPVQSGFTVCFEPTLAYGHVATQPLGASAVSAHAYIQFRPAVNHIIPSHLALVLRTLGLVLTSYLLMAMRLHFVRFIPSVLADKLILATLLEAAIIVLF
ncbi:unnamed protein product [Protopolystoma xenopodis]|uniref:Uncharacterized protein n=1 Tax=Protopolystoma xenopodis TaxID=117903 RepID=A0A3S4ZGQ0_9PLAT|nr:unnamed protein product [Protopolystoma xenopodis]